MRVAIIGGGVMGEIIARSLVQKHVITNDQIVIAEISPERRKELSSRYGFHVIEKSTEAVKDVDLAIICVKPQSAGESLPPLRGLLKPEALVISIMAGVKLNVLQEMLGHSNIVRSMPNIPAQIGEGMTVWMADGNVPDLQLLLAKMVFQAFGLELQVKTDDMVDAATAVSGTGPAYIFYVAEKLIESSKMLGFSDEQSQRLIRQTFQGAMNLWDKTGKHPEKLREMVTSAKGTTAAAMKKFDDLDTGKNFKEAVNAAYKRAKELGESVSGFKSH